MKPVSNYYPRAEVYFLGSNWDYFHGVEVKNIVSVTVTTNMQGSPGVFSVVLDNGGDQYFTDDDLGDISEINVADGDIQSEGPIAWFRREHVIEEVAVDGRIFPIITDSVTGERFYWKDGKARTPPAVVTRRSGKTIDLYKKYGGEFRKGRCLIRPMDRVAIFLRRRYPKTEQEMVLVFVGLISSVQDKDSGTHRELVLTGEDVTKWLRLSRVNINPSLISMAETEREPIAQAYYSNAVTTGLQGWQIVEVLIAGGNLKDYGVAADVPIRGIGQWEVTREEDPTGQSILMGKPKSEVSNRSVLEIFKKSRLNIQVPSTASSFVPYKRYFSHSGSGLKSEYRDRASILQDVARDTNFWFYADGQGNLNYHAPRFDLKHILAAPNPEVYIIEPESILNWALSEDDKDLWSRIEVTGREDWSADGNLNTLLRWNWYENPLLVARYGLRVLLIDHPFARDEEDAFYIAKTLMLRLNKERLQGQITITGRPELRIGYPVFLPYRNMIYNVMSVTHSYVHGETVTTSIGLAYGRKPWDPLPEMLDYGTGTDSLVNFQSDLLDTAASRQDKIEAARKREDPLTVRRNADIEYVVIHHSASKDDTARTIDTVHRSQMGWPLGLGYDVVITPSGILQIGNRWVNSSTDDGIIDRATIDEFFRYPVHRWAAGCDASEVNLRGVHVCLIGNLDNEEPTAPQMATLVAFLRRAVQEFSLNTPFAIKGHNDFEATACPGAKVNLSEIRLRVCPPEELELKRSPRLLMHERGVYGAS
jgi:hypothetical protein